MEFQAPVNMQDGLMGLSALTSLQDSLNGIPLKIEASGETEGAVGSASFSDGIRMLCFLTAPPTARLPSCLWRPPLQGPSWDEVCSVEVDIPQSSYHGVIFKLGFLLVMRFILMIRNHEPGIHTSAEHLI